MISGYIRKGFDVSMSLIIFLACGICSAVFAFYGLGSLVVGGLNLATFGKLALGICFLGHMLVLLKYVHPGFTPVQKIGFRITWVSMPLTFLNYIS